MEITKHIENALKGDQSSYTFLLNHYWNEVYGFMLRRTENETNAEDISIETFAKAFDKLSTYNSQFQFNTWLISIAKNVHIDNIRKKNASLFVETSQEDARLFYNIPDNTPTIEDKIITEQNLSQLLRFIKELKPDYQELIQLRYFQEMSYQEIANKIEEPLSNVKIKILRAKRMLAEIILQKQ